MIFVEHLEVCPLQTQHKSSVFHHFSNSSESLSTDMGKILLKTPPDVQGLLQLLAELDLQFLQKHLCQVSAFWYFPVFDLSHHRHVLWQCRV